MNCDLRDWRKVTRKLTNDVCPRKTHTYSFYSYPGIQGPQVKDFASKISGVNLAYHLFWSKLILCVLLRNVHHVNAWDLGIVVSH